MIKEMYIKMRYNEFYIVEFWIFLYSINFELCSRMQLLKQSDPSSLDLSDGSGAMFSLGLITPH